MLDNAYSRFSSLLLAAVYSIAFCAPAPGDEEVAIVPEDAGLGRPVEFERDVYPIFQANCIACHNKAKSEGDLSLENSETVMKGGSSGQVIVPGKPEESYLYKVVARTEESFMPPWPNEVQAKKLTPKQLGIIKQWIAEGARGGSSASAANMQWQAINSGLTAIYSVDADPFGSFVAAGRAGTVSIYDLLAPGETDTLIDPALAANNSPSQVSHRDYVHAIAFQPSGEMVATSGFRVVKLWTRNIAEAIHPLTMPSTTIQMAAGATGEVSAIHQADGVIRFFDRKSQSMIGECSGYDPAATKLLGIHGGDSQWISVAHADGKITLINRADNSVVGSCETTPSKAISAVYIEANNKLIVLQEDGSLLPMTFDAKAGTLTAMDALRSDKGAIQQIAISATTLMCRIEGQWVELRKADSLQPAVTIQGGIAFLNAAISIDAQRVATIATDGKPELWNAADGKLLATLNSDIVAARTLNAKTTDKAVRDARVAVVKSQITEDEKRVTEQQDSLKKAEEEVKKATDALTEAKKKLDEASPKTVEAKKMSEEKPDDAGLKKQLEEAEKAEQAAKDAVTTAENTLKSAEKSKELSEQAIKRAEAKVAERKMELSSVEAEALVSADALAKADASAKQPLTAQLATFVGTTFVATIDVTGTTRFWKFSDGTPVDVLPNSLPEAEMPVDAIGGSHFLTMRLANGQLMSVNSFPKWTLSTTLGPQGADQPSVFVDRVLSLAFSPDGSILATGGGEASRSGELTLWNVADGSLIRNFKDAHSDTVYGLDFSADGKLIASAAADKFVKVFNVASGQHVRSYEGHTHHVMDVSWKGDGTTLASAGADNAIKVWNAETGEQSRTITTYTKQVTSLSFIGMEDEFISCSGDKRVFRHKAANGGTVREFKGCPDYVYCSATTDDGKIVAAGCEDGILRVWNGADGKVIASFAPVQ